MELLAEIKRRMMAAMKAGDTVQKEILRVLVGEVTTNEARGTVKGDDDVRAIVRKLVKSNEETLAHTTDDEARATLSREVEILRTLLPQTLGVGGIIEALAPISDALRGESNAGKATGTAMKHLQAQGHAVEGKDVAEAVRRLRG